MQIKVDSKTISESARTIDDAARIVFAIVDQLESTLTPLSERWTGAAQAAYLTAQASWNQEMRRMGAVLAAAADVSAQGSTTFADQEKVHESLWK